MKENRSKRVGNGGKLGKMEECQEKSRKKTTENEGKWLKTGGNGGKLRHDRKKGGTKRRKIVENRRKWRKMEEHGGMPGKKVGKKRQKRKVNGGMTRKM